MKPHEHDNLPAAEWEDLSASVSDAALDDRLERVTRFARRMFQVPVVWVSLLQKSELRVRRVQGLPASVVGTRLTLDEFALGIGGTVIIPDVTRDRRLMKHHISLGRRDVRAYASCPIRNPALKVTGIISIADTAERAWGAGELILLRDLAALVETDILVTALGESRLQLLATAETLRNSVLIDPHTQLWNRAASIELVERELDRSRRYAEPVALLLVGVDGLARLRAAEGAATADIFAVEVASRLRECFRGSDIVGRFEEDCFIGFLSRCTQESTLALVDRIRERVAAAAIRIGDNHIPVSLSYGVAAGTEAMRWSPQDLVETAAEALAAARAAGTDRVVSKNLD